MNKRTITVIASILVLIAVVWQANYVGHTSAQTLPIRATFTGKAVTVTTAGTKVAVTPNVETRAHWLLIQVKSTNTGLIYVTTSNDTQIRLEAPVANAVLPYYSISAASSFFDMSKVWIDSSVNGEGVNIHYLQTAGNPF